MIKFPKEAASARISKGRTMTLPHRQCFISVVVMNGARAPIGGCLLGSYYLFSNSD